MTVSARQTELFAGEVWTSIYQAFARINFNATDPISINQALRSYIQANYPDSYNDWIVSSEFVAIIDLLSWLAGTLAFKTDLAARENFIDTAEARESILRLARFLSYNPSRCRPAIGVLKVIAVSTDDDVYDSFGVDLVNTTILWNDPNNANWFEQYTTILNNAFVGTNPFGVPLKNGTVSGVTTQLYRINGFASTSSLGFSSTVSGTSMDFEVCNGDFADNGILFERPPNPSNALNLFYLNDSQGNTSARTGFFFLFKQGTTQQQLYSITVPIENQLLDVNNTNISQDDVWVQTVDDLGAVTINWVKVQDVFNSNVTFNDIPPAERHIFSVLTRDNDQITARFSDGRFGDAPSGNVQITYRVCNGLSYQIKPLEIDNITLNLLYINPVGVQKTLGVTLALYESVANATVAETIEQIRQRAPQVYASQARMVSGEDYNSFPLATNLAAKIKAVNRVYSGQSRYIDLHDPTGTYQDLSLFADDGILFRDPSDTYLEVPAALNKTADQIVNDYIVPAIDQYTTVNLISDVLMQNLLGGKIVSVANSWVTASANLFETTGWFTANDPLIQPGAIIRFLINGSLDWVAVVDIQGVINPSSHTPGTAGPVTLAKEVPTGSTVTAILPSASVQMSDDVVHTISNNIQLRLSFSLAYDYSNSGSLTGPIWVIGPPKSAFDDAEPMLNGTQLVLMIVNYISGVWRINGRGLRYVFESVADIEWFDNGERSLAQLTGEAKRDIVRVLRINRNLNDPSGYALPLDYSFAIDRLWLYPEGTTEPRRASVMLYDSNQDGYPDRPDAYYALSPPSFHNNTLFWSNAANPPYDIPIHNVVAYDTDVLRMADIPAVGTVGFQLYATSYLDNETFWLFTESGWRQDVNGVYRMEHGRGPNVAAKWVTASGPMTPSGDTLSFHWQHYAPTDHRIDPSSSNIIDIFVLTFAYDAQVRQWIDNGAIVDALPPPPTELDLRLAFAAMEPFKMYSDQIVWRPTRYKMLFGNGADPELKAQIKVVRVPNATISDGEIRSRIIGSIKTYFAVNNWDFGETFYFTELAGYIHQQLAGLIGSVVLVPLAADAAFGDGFEVTCRADEIFISTAQVSDIVLIPSNTAINLRIYASPNG